MQIYKGHKEIPLKCRKSFVREGVALSKIDLTGHSFGKLTVLYEVEPINYTRYWLCRCDCGNEKKVAQGNLKRGLSRSCGCNRTGNGHVIDLKGRIFGRLTAIKCVGSANRSALWECQCLCGAITHVRSRDLLNNKTASCGCLKRENAKTLESRSKKYIVDGVKTPLLTKKMKRSKTGVKGVHEILYASGVIKYRATIGIKRKRYNLGTYDSLEEATKVRKKAEEIYHLPYIEKLKK